MHRILHRGGTTILLLALLPPPHRRRSTTPSSSAAVVVASLLVDSRFRSPSGTSVIASSRSPSWSSSCFVAAPRRSVAFSPSFSSSSLSSSSRVPSRFVVRYAAHNRDRTERRRRRAVSTTTTTAADDAATGGGDNRRRTMSSNDNASTNSPSAAAVIHADETLVDGNAFDVTRTRLLTPRVPRPREIRTTDDVGGGGGGRGGDDSPCVVYWMMRDVRSVDNWALLFAWNLAVGRGVPLRVAYALPPPPPPPPPPAETAAAVDGEDGSSSSSSFPPNPQDMPMTSRHGTFLLEGLRAVSIEFANIGVPFDVLRPKSRASVGESISSYCIGAHVALAVVCDMSPLRHHRDWTEIQAARLLEDAGVPLYQVDAHNIVPVWIASNKREVGARTLRPRINSVFARYCTRFPDFDGNAHVEVGSAKSDDGGGKGTVEHDWEGYETYLNLDPSVGKVDGVEGGRNAAMERFREFCTSKQHGLRNFDTLRNDPNHPNVCSNLSPWINAGHVAFQRLALDVRAMKSHPNGTASYIEEGVVRRELSDNYVYYTPDVYDSLDAAAGWARESLELHASDVRENLYSWRELEAGMTHDDLWNAAQLQLVREGKMHGFMRMYWAKKILEWTISPSYALASAQYFNDRYAYDGNDPNGYVGVGWSIMGIHDMGWKERPVFGKIRYMNYAGCKRKFKVDQFVARYRGASENAARVTSGAKGGGIEKFLGKKRKA
ncbi:hypothetical protein ACHAXA_003509 [Cyclostephanos tholiformis]|uniref:Deoxyribodipyrimidine photo-lyase n=1 Tax=Cyclostephanos tholiformis TaxID=382380 RepID=A0ABD3SFG4_9STRA